jgi:MFS family permease
MATTTANDRSSLSSGHVRVITASSVGTMFEWYDFYLYGSLAANIAAKFFSGLDPTSGLIMALLAFAAGFFVRPFGALLFGRLGDLIGRKYTFLITIIIMGSSTFLVGLIPTYATIGLAAPVILIILRLLQGLALGGEYGGAATYVAEHAPPGKRGFYTSFIQITATFGLFLSLIVILLCKNLMSKEDFEAWGWRIPFLISFFLLLISVYIRLQLQESPLFQQMKAEGRGSKSPLTESFMRWDNMKIVLLALFGATAGEAVVWYGGQFYSLFFLQNVIKVDPSTVSYLIAGALLIATPFFVVFGALSDKIGRKPIIMAGCLLAALTYFPIFKGLTHYANPALETASATNPVVVNADPKSCAFQFDPVGKRQYKDSCDIAKNYLSKAGVPYTNKEAPAGTPATVQIGSTSIASFEGGSLDADTFKTQSGAFGKSMGDALKAAGYPAKADPAAVNWPMLLLLLTILVIYVTMVYGPIAAWLVELFPTRIRYSSLSLPYHIGNGWFGGFLPSISFALVAFNGDIYFGLWYTVVISVMTLIIGTLFLRETKDVDISR